MKCPKCSKRMKVTHSYATDSGNVQRFECNVLAGGCGAVVTGQVVVLNVDPDKGQGARAVAQRLNGTHGKA